MEGTVEELFDGLVKSCRRYSLESMNLGEIGPVDSRVFVIADRNAAGNHACTQRKYPHMALIDQKRLESTSISITIPGQRPYFLQDPETFLRKDDFERLKVRIHDDTFKGYVVDHPEATKTLSSYLGTDCAIVRVPVEGRTKKSNTLGREIQTQGDDGYPLTVVSLAAIDAFGEWLGRQGHQIPKPFVQRFRPDIVIRAEMHQGLPAEGMARKIHIGDAILTKAKPCTRCHMIENNPDTGEVDYSGLCELLRQYCKENGVGDPTMTMNYLVEHPSIITINDQVVLDM